MSDCCNKENCCSGEHPDHSAQLSRLNRVSGQVEGIKKMIEERRYCPDIMTQLRAIRSAIKSVEGNILEAHLAGCVTQAIQQGNAEDRDAKINEISELFKRYND